MKIIENKLNFYGMDLLNEVNYLVVHHTATTYDMPLEELHNMHQNDPLFKYAGIGYHYYIRKNGEIFKGRDEKFAGAHVIGKNFESLGICLSGNFEIEEPTAKQINSLSEILRFLKSKYKNAEIVGHCDLYATKCPGKNFYKMLKNLSLEKRKAKLFIHDGYGKIITDDCIYELDDIKFNGSLNLIFSSL